MKNNVHTLRSAVFAVVFILGANARAAAPFSFVQQPDSHLAEVGTFAAFSGQVAPPAGATFQWRFNGVPIPGATNQNLVITPEESKVGAYRLHAWSGTNYIISSNAFLGVYELYGTNSTGGKLTVSASSFPSAPTGGYWCSNYSTVIFDKYLNPKDSGRDSYCYGPSVGTGYQNPPFINWDHCRFVEIMTSGSFNIPTWTGVRLTSSYDASAPVPIPPFVYCGCESGDSTTLPRLSCYDMTSESDERKSRYRVTIFYKSPMPASGNIVFNWNYFN